MSQWIIVLGILDRTGCFLASLISACSPLLYKDLSLISSKDHGTLQYLPIGLRVGFRVVVVVEGQLGKSDNLQRNIIILQYQHDFILATVDRTAAVAAQKVVSVSLNRPKVPIHLMYSSGENRRSNTNAEQLNESDVLANPTFSYNLGHADGTRGRPLCLRAVPPPSSTRCNRRSHAFRVYPP